MESFSRYKIIKQIGQSHFCLVFAAYDPLFKREVALKIFSASLAHDPLFHQRFDKEIKVISRLRHPAIVPIYDFGDEDGQLFLVMRLMKGGSLSDRLEKGPIDLKEAENILKRISSALDYCHQKGIVHRDLKPGNILFDQIGEAYLADSGLVHLLASNWQITATGNMVGTPNFMSPEQVKGDREIDGRADIYSLGIILFEMVTGQAPYNGDTPLKVMMQHIMEPIPRPTTLDPTLPDKLDNVILRALAKDPAERQSTAGELVEELTSGFSSVTVRKKMTRYHEDRQLDVAIAKELIVEQVAELLAMVRRTESGGLKTVLQLESEYTPQPDDVASKPFQMEFPNDNHGEPQPGELILKVDAPDFAPTVQEKTILVPVAGDSEPVVFLLTPQRVGNLIINLELYRKRVHIGQQLLRVNGRPPGSNISSEQTFVSIPLSVFSTLPASQKAMLQTVLDSYFNLEEIEVLCLQLGIDFENLEGKTKSAKAKALVTYAERHGQLVALVSAIQEERPHLHLKMETIVEEYVEYNSSSTDTAAVLTAEESTELLSETISTPKTVAVVDDKEEQDGVEVEIDDGPGCTTVILDSLKKFLITLWLVGALAIFWLFFR